jgi:hypothetical protein
MYRVVVAGLLSLVLCVGLRRVVWLVASVIVCLELFCVCSLCGKRGGWVRAGVYCCMANGVFKTASNSLLGEIVCSSFRWLSFKYSK